MRHTPRLAFLTLLLVLSLVAAPTRSFAGEDADQRAISEHSDPCSFFRAQAYGRGLEHFATEMLWACEAIAIRRAADITLSERLIAVELALARYRAAIIETGSTSFARDRVRDLDSGHIGASESTRAQLAESTGMFAALEAVRSGF